MGRGSTPLARPPAQFRVESGAACGRLGAATRPFLGLGQNGWGGVRMILKLTREDLSWAASEGIVTEAQADALWIALERRIPDRPKFDAAHVLYYFGAMIIIGAMSFFMTLGWDSLGGGFVLGVSCAYAAVFAFVGWRLWNRGLRVPAGLLVTIAVCMAPLAIYGLERVTGFWALDDPGHYRDFNVYVNGSWILMELGTI